VQVLLRVAEEGAFASRALDGELQRARLSPRDAALATELVYGTLRALPRVDAAFGPLLRDPRRTDPLLRAALRAATYQILFLSRVPPHAAVDEAVGLVGRARGRTLAGVANAVLRQVAAARPPHPEPPRTVDVPAWLHAALVRGLGETRAAAFLASRTSPPPLGLRVEDTSPQARAALVERLRAALPDRASAAADGGDPDEGRAPARVEAGAVSPRAVLLRGAGDPRALPGHAEGAFTVQEEGAQAVALALGARPGERVADVCAGHGGKTTLLARAVGPAGHVAALDLHEDKLAHIPPELDRLGLPRDRVSLHAVDLTVGAGGLGADFDRVLVDAPCTGLGTLHRRPELLMRIGASDPARMAALQRAILRTAARLVRPGGTLLYATCSPTRDESLDVVTAVLAERPDLRLRAADFIGPWLAPTPDLAPDTYAIVHLQRAEAGDAATSDPALLAGAP
jgi:16S rRNA (cytosine967-C5)-methyltransferase